VATKQNGYQWPDNKAYLLKCFCWQGHSVFSATCDCNSLPLSYFLVSRQFRDLTLQKSLTRHILEHLLWETTLTFPSSPSLSISIFPPISLRGRLILVVNKH